MKKLLLLFTLMLMLSCGKSENYEMKGLDFVDKVQVQLEKKQSAVDAYWDLIGATDDTTQKNEYKELIKKENEEFSVKYLDMSKEDYALFVNGLERLKDNADFKAMKNSTVSEIIEIQKQIEGK